MSDQHNRDGIDPFLNQFMSEWQLKATGIGNDLQILLNRMHNSFCSNSRISVKYDRDLKLKLITCQRSIFTAYFGVFYTTIPNKVDDRSIIKLKYDSIKTINSILEEIARFRRNNIRRYTSIDRDFTNILRRINDGTRDFELIYGSLIERDPRMLDEIYDRITSHNLEQEAAPFLFDVVDYIVDVREKIILKNARQRTTGIESLLEMVVDLLSVAEKTNIDKRVIDSIKKYKDLLTNSFNPIHADLFSNLLRSYLGSYREEISPILMAHLTSVLLTQDQVFSQFADWRDFNARSQVHLETPDAYELKNDLLETINNNIKHSATANAMEAFSELIETNQLTEAKISAHYGIWKSSENFIKENIRFLVNEFKNRSVAIFSKSNERYLLALERILPATKLVCKSKENLLWLVPVIEWLQETLRTRPKPL